MLLDANISDSAGSDGAATSARQTLLPLRPIQYLGNKLRALSDILDAADELVGAGARIGDLFTGTTVVAQGFAARGYRVSAVDTQQYAVHFANALLGIGRCAGESCSFDVFSRLGLIDKIDEFTRPWKSFYEREQDALIRRDASALADLTSDLPLIWRQQTHPLLPHIERSDYRSALGEVPLLTSIYAGYYFGVWQALVLDQLRHNLEVARKTGRVSQWQYCAALTAIMSAASAAVHSAGKHFAQPLNVGTLRNERFLSTRLLQDRTVDILGEFQAACDAIDSQAVPKDNAHIAWCGAAETFAINSGSKHDLFYLDPPYTAQQYSRFYHVLETICSYNYPQIFSDRKITTGLYPSNRYKSSFSSRRKAPLAFRNIIAAAHENGIAMAISYSQSSENSNGNARMISLKELLDLCSAEFGTAKVDWFQLSHRYRQFNSSAVSNVHRNDPEILITCKPR